MKEEKKRAVFVFRKRPVLIFGCLEISFHFFFFAIHWLMMCAMVKVRSSFMRTMNDSLPLTTVDTEVTGKEAVKNG